MNSLRSQEGYLLVDHRYSPGIPDETAIKAGIPAGAAGADTVFEAATFTCADCEKVVIINRKRTRPRGYCPKCNHYLCDECEAIRFASGGECRNLKNYAEELRNQRAKTGVSSEVFQSPIIIL